jgi:hypothetical protein
VGAHLGARERHLLGEDGSVIRRGVVALVGFVWKVVAVILVTLLVLFLLGWVVDVVVDPAEEEITTVER